MISSIPVDKLSDADFDRCAWTKTDIALQGIDVRKRGLDVARLHRQHVLHRSATQSGFQCCDQVHQFDGLQTRSFCYCSDLLDGMLRLMDQDDQTGPVNIGNPVENTMLELAEAVIQGTGSSSKIAHRPLPEDDPKKRCPDITRARKWLGWEPQVPLAEGLKKTIEWYRAKLGMTGT